jgi:hypothetical protein
VWTTNPAGFRNACHLLGAASVLEFELQARCVAFTAASVESECLAKFSALLMAFTSPNNNGAYLPALSNRRNTQKFPQNGY